MNDRELLEMAAKAFGFGAQNPPDNQHCWTQSEYPKRSGRHGALWNYVGHGETAELWNPLTDDGDALRLGVALRIKHERHPIHPFVAAWAPEIPARFEEPEGDDPCAATRRAIVRAAAAIGQKMEAKP